MDNPPVNEDPNFNKQINDELFKKSAALKKKNGIVMEKLLKLKKMSEEFLKTGSASKR